ncbi:uncharacterized protein LOC135821682 [Sycon ciliatum]|uniref:uncharacterized protein LOC135821682 n=1 Tax=Sycon ciliatum TaxID=27933 RepID=UPI0031F67427
MHHNVDLAIVTETKLTPEKATPVETSIPGYHPAIRRDRTAHGGGVAIWVKGGLSYRQLNIDCADQEMLWISITGPQGTNVGVCRPGSCADNDIRLFSHLDAGIDAARCSCSRVIVAGDFNVHNTNWLGSRRTTLAGETAEDLCYQHSLTQHIHEATRGRNTLDLVMSDVPGNIISTLYPPLGQSDHAVVITDFELTPHRDRPTARTVWRYQHADWDRLRAFYRDTDWTEIITDEPDTTCNLVTQRIIKGMTRFIPSKVLKTKPTDPVWWTPECSAAVAAKRHAWRSLRRSQANPALQEQYRLARVTSSTCLSRAKEHHLQRIRNKLLSGNIQDKEWWSVGKRAGGSGRDSTMPVLLDSDGQEYTQNRDKAEIIGSYFAEK